MNIKKIFLFLLFILSLFSVYSTGTYTPEIHANTQADTTIAGWKIITGADFNVTSVTLGAGNTASTVYIKDSSFITLDSATTTSRVATFNYKLEDGNTYYIVADSGGASYTESYYNGGTFPYVYDDFTISCSQYGTLPGTCYTVFIFDVQSITTIPSVIVLPEDLSFTTINANDVALVNNSFYNSNIIFNTTVLNTSTNPLVNQSYSLNGASFIQYATDELNGSFNLNLSTGVYNISFKALNNETSTITSQYNFTVDRVIPIITNNIPSEINSYDFNGSWFSCSDDHLVLCEISIDGVTQNSGVDFTLTHNGNLSYNITAQDAGGNQVVENGNILINPYQLFNFQLSNGSTVTDFTFGGLNFTNQASIETYNSIISLGNNSLLFEKLGAASQNVTFNLNTTSIINLTTIVTQSQINIRIFDRETNVLLTGLTAITIQATYGFNGSTTTGLLNVSNINFISEQYQILAEHEGYSTENVFFNYNNQETLNVDIFMLNATAPEEGQIKIIVKNTLSQFVESAVCSALEWRPSESAYVSVGQGLSNVIGETLLNIELNTKIYQFSCTKDTFTTVTNGQIVQIADSSLTIILNDVILAPTPLFPNLVTSLINTTINSTHQLITYTFADSDGLTTEACLNVYLVNGNRQNLNQQNCVSSSTGTLLLTVDINQTSDILIQGALTTSEVSGYVTDSLTIKGVGDIAGQFKVIGLDVILPTILVLLGLGLGILLSKIEIAAVFVAIAGWVSVAFVPTIMSASIAMFISVVVGLMLWLGFNRK